MGLENIPAQAFEALQGIFNVLRDSAQFVLFSGGDKSKALVIFSGVILGLFVLANIYGLVNINSMIYGDTNTLFDSMGNEIDVSIDQRTFLESLDKVKVYKPLTLAVTTPVGSWEEVQSARLSSSWGVIWNEAPNEIFGITFPSLDMLITGRDADYNFAIVAVTSPVLSNNGTSSGYYSDVEDFVEDIESGEICYDDLSWGGGLQIVPYSYDSSKLAFVSDCYFLRYASTQEKVSLIQATVIAGADSNTTVFGKIYEDIGIKQIIDYEDLSYTSGGLLTPLIIIDSALQFTAKTLDLPTSTLFNVELFSPLYSFVRETIMYMAFIALCLFCLSLVWHTANR